MTFTQYHLYLCTATVSGLASLVMIILLWQNTKSMSRNLVSQALVLYGCFDILGTCSWLVADKYNTTFETCATQEYMFQGANLFKAVTTVLISYLAYSVVKHLRPPSLDKQFLQLTALAYLAPCLVLALSIHFKTGSLFCGDSDSDRHSLAYVGVFMPPLFICVGLNFFLYRVIKIRTKHIVQFFSVIYQTSSASVDAQLLVIVNKLRIYPTVFCFCWLPEVVYITALIGADRRLQGVGAFSGVCINSTGTLVAACYFYQRYDLARRGRRRSVTRVTEGAGGGAGGGDRIVSQQDSSRDSSLHSSAQNPMVISSLTSFEEPSPPPPPPHPTPPPPSLSSSSPGTYCPPHLRAAD